MASVAIGSKPIAFPDVWKALTDFTGTDDDIVVVSLRIPRTLIGLLAGSALGLAGA